MNILFFILSIVLVIAGAEFLVDGASGIAKKYGMSEFLIGVTIVGIGTSTPEMVVSFIAAIQGNADITVGNIVGSNLFNTFFILGITALIAPISFTKHNIKRDIPFGAYASILLLILSLDGSPNTIGRIDGIILICCFILFMSYSFLKDKSNKEAEKIENGETDCRQKSLVILLVMVIGGLAGLVYGGKMFVDSSTAIARKLGVSDAVIAITLMAGGTSLPELVSCIIAAVKKKGQLALGNVLGSNISNILLIIGGSAIITPLKMSEVTFLSIFVVVISSILLFLTAFTFKKKYVDRWEGAIFIVLYISYIISIL